MRAELDAARRLLEEAGRIVFLTGAGISAESGVPTFRGEGGLWRTYRAEDLATPRAFRRDPRLVWEWYAWRRSVVAGCADPRAALPLATVRSGGAVIEVNPDETPLTTPAAVVLRGSAASQLPELLS